MSRKHRHRENKVKKMHSIIGNYSEVLDALATIPEIQSVITGTISPNKAETEEMTFQYFTESGLKLLAKTTEAVQEIFIVSDEKQRVLDELRTRGFLQEKVKKVKKNAKPTTAKKTGTQLTGNTSRSNVRYNPSDAPKDKPMTLKDLINKDVLEQLQAQSNEMKAQEREKEEQRRQAEIDRRAKEKKELENNFEYLLNNTKLNWKDYK